MRDSLTSRGPDEAGHRIYRNVGIASRRLSILDLADGQMPMGNEDGSVWVVFNGEIYNFDELRGRLIEKGHVFKTRGDTETLLHAYEEYGSDCVSYFNGMFAFAIHDQKAGKIFMARDRLGEKPLHYYWDGNLFLFGSEIKSLLAHHAVPRRLDPLSLSKYLTYEYVPAPHTLFQNIKKVEPGHWLSLDIHGRQLTQETYWDLPLTDDNINYQSEEGYAEELLHRLDESVKMRLVSDVPIGVFLSGGIDSSMVAALAARHHNGPLKAFTVAFDDPSFDESKHARQVAAHLSLEHHVEMCEVRLMPEKIPSMLSYLDEPIGDASFVPTHMLSHFAGSHLKVVLGGDGCDELLAGYPTYQALKLIRFYNVFPSEIRAMINRMAGMLPVSRANISFDFKIKQLLRGAGVSPEVMFFLWMGSFNESEKRELLTPSIRSSIFKKNVFEDLFDYIKQSNLKGEMERALYLSTKLYLQDDILVKVDRASMANSLEVRAPFLDHTLVEFIAHLPTPLKLHKLTGKYLLKKAASKLLPKNIIHRRKKGFGMPVGNWINGQLAPLFNEVLSPSNLERGGLFDPVFVAGLLQRHRSGAQDNRKFLWTLFAFQLWHEKWMK